MHFPLPSFDQEKAQLFSELLPDGVVSVGPDARVIYLNSRAERITGLARSELVGQDVREALELRDRDGSLWWEKTDPWGGLNIRTGHREKLLMLGDGREVLVTAKYHRPAPNQPVQRVLMGLRDAEARHRAEADHAALISTVAHELRSPLTSVKGFSSTLLRRWERFTDDQKRLMIETIEADADRVTRLITELLDVSRLDAGRLAIHPRPVDLAAIFAQHVERSVASGHPRERFAIDVAEDLPEVWVDPDRLDQILANLIENALRHGRGTISLVGRNGHGDGPATDIIVSDEGEGIPEAHRVLVFTRFWQGGHRGSTGLGLYVVRGLVMAHGGTIAVEDAPGGGAQIRLTMPCTPPEHLI